MLSRMQWWLTDNWQNLLFAAPKIFIELLSIIQEASLLWIVSIIWSFLETVDLSLLGCLIEMVSDDGGGDEK